MGKIISFLSGIANVVFKTCIVTISNVFKESIFYHYGFFDYLIVSTIKINFCIYHPLYMSKKAVFYTLIIFSSKHKGVFILESLIICLSFPPESLNSLKKLITERHWCRKVKKGFLERSFHALRKFPVSFFFLPSLLILNHRKDKVICGVIKCLLPY